MSLECTVCEQKMSKCLNGLNDCFECTLSTGSLTKFISLKIIDTLYFHFAVVLSFTLSKDAIPMSAETFIVTKASRSNRTEKYLISFQTLGATRQQCHIIELIFVS